MSHRGSMRRATGPAPSRRRVLRAFALGLPAAALAACGGGAPPGNTAAAGSASAGQSSATLAQAPVSTTQSAATASAAPAPAAPAGQAVAITWLVRSDMGAGMNGWEQRTADAYAKTNAGVKVNLVGVAWGDYNAKLLAMFAASQIPEAFANFAAGFGTFLVNGALAEFNPYLERDHVNITDTFEKSAIDALTRDGKILGLPEGDEGTYLFYNRTMFDEAGVTPPPNSWDDKSWTLDAMVQAARKMTHDVTDPRKGAWGAIFTAQQLGVGSWLFGVDPFNDKGGPEQTKAYQTGTVTAAYLTNPKFVSAMQWFADLALKEKVSPLPSDVNALQQGVGDPFVTGRIGMYVNGQWETQSVKSVQGKWKWGVAPLPYGPAGVNTSPLYNDSFFLGKGAKHVDDGYRFLKYVAFDAPAQDYVQTTGYWPARRDLWDFAAKAFASIPGASQAADEIKALLTAAFSHGFVTPGKVLDRYVELNNAWTQTTAPIWSGQATAAQGLQQAQAKYQTLIQTK